MKSPLKKASERTTWGTECSRSVVAASLMSVYADVCVQAMGWSEGEGLGRSKQGRVEPIQVMLYQCHMYNGYAGCYITG